eukprot:4706121-Amphidinium_carterae.1
MIHLQLLRVAVNSFTGTLSDSFLRSADLALLDISHNCLAGPLPAALSSVSVMLQLSHNDFEGLILSRIDAQEVFISYNALAVGSAGAFQYSQQLDQ